MAKTIAIVNQKGGVGKTTTCVNLAAALFERGKRVLLCDFDPQANSTSGMGVDKTVSKGIYEALIGETPVEDAIVHTKFGDVLPSNKALAGAGIELIGMERRTMRTVFIRSERPSSAKYSPWTGTRMESAAHSAFRVSSSREGGQSMKTKS